MIERIRAPTVTCPICGRQYRPSTYFPSAIRACSQACTQRAIQMGKTGLTMANAAGFMPRNTLADIVKWGDANGVRWADPKDVPQIRIASLNNRNRQFH